VEGSAWGIIQARLRTPRDLPTIRIVFATLETPFLSPFLRGVSTKPVEEKSVLFSHVIA
jgi:hypothetical protein